MPPYSPAVSTKSGSAYPTSENSSDTVSQSSSNADSVDAGSATLWAEGITRNTCDLERLSLQVLDMYEASWQEPAEPEELIDLRGFVLRSVDSLEESSTAWNMLRLDPTLNEAWEFAKKRWWVIRIRMKQTEGDPDGLIWASRKAQDNGYSFYRPSHRDVSY